MAVWSYLGRSDLGACACDADDHLRQFDGGAVTKRKWLHAGLLALVGALTDIGAQLASGAVDPSTSRAVLVGLAIGGMARILGAILAVEVTSDEPPAS